VVGVVVRRQLLARETPRARSLAPRGPPSTAGSAERRRVTDLASRRRVRQAGEAGAASEQDGRRCELGRRGRSSLSVRSNLRTLSGVSAPAGQGPGCRGPVRLASPGRPRRAPRRYLGRGSAPPSTTTRAARRGSARPRRFGLVIDRACRADRVGFGDGLRPLDALPERGRSTRRRTRGSPSSHGTATRSVDDKPSRAASVAKPLRQGRSTSMQSRGGETSRRSSSSSSANARRAWVVGGRAPRRRSAAGD
jgi:hypothetical protein